jgi:hypothetical protein
VKALGPCGCDMYDALDHCITDLSSVYLLCLHTIVFSKCMFVLVSGYRLLIMYLFACLSYYRSLSDVLKRETGVHGVDGPCISLLSWPLFSTGSALRSWT